MKLPKEINKIVGENKLRDLAICLDYISGKDPSEIIAERNLALTTRRIEQIVYANAAFVNPKVAWPKAKRVRLRQRLILRKIAGKQDSNKDILDHLDGLQKEIDGEKSLVDQSTHYHVTLQQLAKEVNGNTGRFDADVQESLPAPGAFLSESVRRQALEQADRDNALGQGQPENNGQIG